jgi:hypothetical protein
MKKARLELLKFEEVERIVGMLLLVQKLGIQDVASKVGDPRLSFHLLMAQMEPRETYYARNLKLNGEPV